MTEPLTGVGLYIRGLSSTAHGTPEEAAKRAVDHGLKHVAILAVWQDLKDGKVRHLAGNLRRDRFLPYAEAFRDAGLAVGFWFYPWGGHEARLLEDLEDASEKFAPDFYLDDGELGHKWSSRSKFVDAAGTMRGGQREAMKGVKAKGRKETRIAQVDRLHKGLHDLSMMFGAKHGIGVTAYGIANYHPTFPWGTKLRGADFFSPQLYRASPEKIDLGIAQWYEHARADRDVVERSMLPSIPTFGQNSGADLDGYLGSFMDAANGVDGFIGWSWRQTSRLEWRTLARWAERLQRGAMTLPKV